MTTVTDYFSITRPVPFENVDINVDTRRFIDPFRIRMGFGPAPFTAAANNCTSTFFDQVTHSVISTDPAERRKGIDLLQHFEEPRETHLGLAKNGVDGHGGAAGIGGKIWAALDGSAAFLVRVGVLHQIEDIPMFVDDVGNDITSDLTTRVIFEPLVDFTADCVANFPELAGGTGLTKVHRQVWDPASLSWTIKPVVLPTANGKPLLLVPKEWVGNNLLLTPTRLYETALLSHVQSERAVITAKGKVLKTPKEKLKEDPQLGRGLETIFRIVEQALGKGTDVVANFKRWAADRYDGDA